MMLSRREIALIFVSVCFTLAMVGAASALDPIMGTTIFHRDEVEADTADVGETHRYFSAATATLLNLELRSMTLRPGRTPHPPRPHQQSAEQLILVKAGTLDVELGEIPENTAGGVDEKMQRLEPGAALFLGPNQWHALRNSGQQSVTYYVIDWLSPGMKGEK